MTIFKDKPYNCFTCLNSWLQRRVEVGNEVGPRPWSVGHHGSRESLQVGWKSPTLSSSIPTPVQPSVTPVRNSSRVSSSKECSARTASIMYTKSVLTRLPRTVQERLPRNWAQVCTCTGADGVGLFLSYVYVPLCIFLSIGGHWHGHIPYAVLYVEKWEWKLRDREIRVSQREWDTTGESSRVARVHVPWEWSQTFITYNYT